MLLHTSACPSDYVHNQFSGLDFLMNFLEERSIALGTFDYVLAASDSWTSFLISQVFSSVSFYSSSLFQFSSSSQFLLSDPFI